jgi:hypothetical protein
MRPLFGFKPISAGSSFRKRLPALLSAASVLCLAGVPAAQATTYVPAFTFKDTTVTFPGQPLLLGYSFSTEFNKTIKAIGIYKSVTSPLNNSLGIWEIKDPTSLFPTYDLLFQTVITTQGSCADDFCWHPASNFLPKVLPVIKQNSVYAIATAWGWEPVPANLEPGDITIVSPGFKVGDNAYHFSSLPNLNADLAGYAPDTSDTTLKKSFYTANLSFETYDSVPTPSPLPLIGAAAAFGWSRKIRRRINPSS